MRDGNLDIVAAVELLQPESSPKPVGARSRRCWPSETDQRSQTMISTTRALRLTACSPATPSRPLFVFLPGMDGSGALLQSQVAVLSAGFDIRCLSIPPDDLRGWDELTEQVAALIRMEQQRHPGRTTTVCGESFGGCLALRLITRFPNLCDQLILVNPASSAQRQPWIGACSSLTQLLPTPIYQLSILSLCNLLIAQTEDQQAHTASAAGCYAGCQASKRCLEIGIAQTVPPGGSAPGSRTSTCFNPGLKSGSTPALSTRSEAIGTLSSKHHNRSASG